MWKRKPKEIPKENSVAEHIKERIKRLGRLHRKGSIDLKVSISALADLFAFRQGKMVHRNPKDKRRKK